MKKSYLLPLPVLLLILCSGSYAQKAPVKKPAVKTATKPAVSARQWIYQDKNDLMLLDVRSGVILLTGFGKGNKDKQDVLGVDAATGKLKWRRDQRDDYIFRSYGHKDMVIFDFSDGLEAIDLPTGATKWKIQFEGRIREDRIHKINFVGDMAYVSLDERGVAAIDLSTGKEKWNFRPCFDMGDDLFVNEKYIVLPCRTSRLFVADSQTGKLLWQKNYYEDLIDRVFLDGDKVIAAVHFYRKSGGTADAFDAATGKPLWTADFNEGNQITDAAIHQKKLYVAFRHGFFWILDTTSGQLLKRFGSEDVEGAYSTRTDNGVGNEVLQKFVFAGDLMAGMTEQNGDLYVFNTKTDNIAGKFASRDSYSNVYLVSPPYVYFDNSGNVGVFDQRTGKTGNLIDRYIHYFKADEAGNVYLIANGNELYCFPKNTVERAVNSHRQLAINKSVAESTSPGRGIGVGTGGGGIGQRSYSELSLSGGKTYLTYFESAARRGALYEFDDSTGAKRTICPIEAAYISDPVVADGIAYFGTAQAKISDMSKSHLEQSRVPGEAYAVETATGKVLWKFQTAGGIMLKPVINGETIAFSATDGNLYSLKREDGSLIWKTSIGIGWNYFSEYQHTGFFAVSDELITMRAAKQVVAFNKNDAAAMRHIGRGGTEFFTVFGDKLFLTDSDNYLFAYELSTGHLLWKILLGKKVNKAFGENQNILYLQANYERLIAIDTRNGSIVWERLVNFLRHVLPIGDELVNGRGSTALIYDGATGVRKKWLQFPGEYVLQEHTDGRILFFRDEDSIVAYDKDKEAVLWKTKIP